MSESKLHVIVANGIIAAIYFILTIISLPISFGIINIRIAEVLVLLCFFRRDYIFGVTLGCILSNLTSNLGAWDILIGGGATFLSCLLICYASPRFWVACIYPIVINCFVIGAELTWILGFPYALSVLAVAGGEFAAMLVGFILYLLLRKRPQFYDIIRVS